MSHHAHCILFPLHVFIFICWNNQMKKIDMHQPYYHSLRITFIKAKYLSLIVGLMAWFQGKDKYLNTIKKRLEVHGTVYVDEKAKTKRSYMPSFVTNHGLQKPEDFHILLRKSKVATVILKFKKLRERYIYIYTHFNY